jgi:glycosyltransferase involved in cell wall biosynthesis
MKILFDATVLVDGNDMVEERRGIFFVARNLLLEMSRFDGVDVVLFASGCKIAGLETVNEMLGTRFPLYRKVPFFSKLLHRLITFFRKKRMANFQKPLFRKNYATGILFFSIIGNAYSFVVNLFCPKLSDVVYFSPRTAPPWFIRRNKCIKKYVVLHDLIPYVLPEYANQRSWGWFGHLIKHLNKDDFYFAISEATKRDYCNFSSKIDPKHVMISYWGADDRFYPNASLDARQRLEKRYGIKSDKLFVFTLCSLEPRKNLLRIIKSFVDFLEKNAIKNMILVVGGGEWLDFKKYVKKSLDESFPLEEYILHIGYVEDSDLPLLYSNAEWFVFTSQYEGFGLPALEAMKCGCPVIASNASSLPEVVGDAGIMIDWNSDEQHVNAFEKYYFDEKLRQENGYNGLQRAKLFSWEKTVKEMLSTMFFDVSA